MEKINNSVLNDRSNFNKEGGIFISLLVIILGLVIVVSLFVWLKQPLEVKDCEKPLEFDPHCLAMVRQDVSYCDNKPDAESVKLCYDGAYMTFALLENNPDECNKVKSEDWKNICIAIVSDDISSCDKAEINSNFCKDVVNRQLPDEGGEDLMDFALFIFALKDNNRSLDVCDQQKNKNSADMCKAIFSGDEEYCTIICNAAER